MSFFEEIYRPAKFAQERSAAFAKKHPHRHHAFLNQPDVSRRKFFEIAGAGLVRPPMAIFEAALIAYAEQYGLA